MNMDTNYFALALDALLVVSSLIALYFFRPRIGGQLAVGLRLIMIGVFVLGLTHLADSIINDFSLIDAATEHLLHRGVNDIGFIVIFIGFFHMKRAIEA